MIHVIKFASVECHIPNHLYKNKHENSFYIIISAPPINN